MSFIEKARDMIGGERGQQAQSLISNLLQQQGGLSGLVEKFKQGGLGDVAHSWISTGKNMPISAEQIRAVLGSETVAKLAKAAGVEPANAAEQLAKFVPLVVDKMTPAGQLPPAGAPNVTPNLMSTLTDLFSHGGTHA
ncbi:MAG: YidB family protein [Bdellovibrionota bacterium]